MKRLLFAAARGARVQAFDSNLGWILSSHARLSSSRDTRAYRIHPDDEHLQYGPISTALRGRVLLDDPDADGFLAATKYASTRWPEFHAFKFADIKDYEMTLLILAEALADEGL